jgi:hypothetical protein
MAKAKKASSGLDFGHLLKSSLITAAVAEIVPLIFGVLYIFWQSKKLGPIEGLNSFISKGTYGWTEMESAMTFGAGAGAIIVLGTIVALGTLIIDEWIFSHKLGTLKEVLMTALAWGATFYLVDKISFALGVSTIAGLSSYTMIVFLTVIMLTPVAIYAARKIIKR